MLKVNRLHLAASALAFGALSLGVASDSFAQANSGQNAAGGILGLFGTIAQEAAKANARKKWDQTAPEVKQCVNTMFAAKNISVDQIVAAGISPTDQRIAPLVASCQTIMTAQPKTNFPCNVTNSKGQLVATTCNESFAKEVNGSFLPISRDDFLRAAGNGEKVQVANFETVAAQSARLAKEGRLAEGDRRAREAQAQAERQRFLTSPEGKQQVAADAELEKYLLSPSGRILSPYDKNRLRKAPLEDRARLKVEFERRAKYSNLYGRAIEKCESYFDKNFSVMRYNTITKASSKVQTTMWSAPLGDKYDGSSMLVKYQLFSSNAYGGIDKDLGLFWCAYSEKSDKVINLYRY